MATVDVDRAKQEIRERIWALLEREHAAPPGVQGYIPAFGGADKAADRLAELPVWKEARVVKAVPDEAQLPVRVHALTAGKLVYMAVPKLASRLPFYRLDPHALNVSAAEGATKEYAAQSAVKVGVAEMQPVDLVICGSVAVNRSGARLGKGAGYSDIEVALLAEAGLISPTTAIVTTVHSLQVIDEPIPETEHDFSVDLIVTPTEVISCPSPRQPGGLVWDHLSPEKIASIPALAALNEGRQRCDELQ